MKDFITKFDEVYDNFLNTATVLEFFGGALFY